MRTKFLLIITSLLIFSSAISSCLDSDETYVYSSDATLQAFGLDTVHGRHYQFTVDQLNRMVYNRDSMPVGADTILDKILIDTLSVSGWVSSGEPKDTVIDTSDSLDLTGAINNSGMKLVVHAIDGSVNNYTLKINVHKQDPDSLVWIEKPAFSDIATDGSQRAALLDDQLMVFTSNRQMFATSTDNERFGWAEAAVDGLPADVKLQSIIAYNRQLFATTESKEVYTTADGMNWTRAEALGNNVIALAAVVDNRLSAIVEIDGKQYFNTTDGTVWSDTHDTGGNLLLSEVEPGFPTDNIYTASTTTANGLNRVVVTGMPETDEERTTPWFSLDGKAWADLSTSSDAYLPAMENPAVFHYGGQLYAMGGQLDTIYTSANSIAWFGTEEKFLPHKDMKGAGAFSLVVDNADGHHYLWMVTGGNGMPARVWRGRLNRLAFLIQ